MGLGITTLPERALSQHIAKSAICPNAHDYPTFRRSASLDGDRKRLAEIVDVLSKYSGEDRFEVLVEANGSARWQLDFPNNRTRVCKELQAELAQRLPAGAWKVEG